MKEMALSSWETSPSGLAFFHQKIKILWFIVVLCSLTMLPLIIKNIVVGYYFLAIVMSTFLLSLYTDTFFLVRKQAAPIHFTVIVGLLVLSILLTVWRMGVVGAFWVFPVSTALVFLLPLSAAIATTTVLVLGVGLMTFNQVDTTIFIRFSLALFTNLMIVFVVLSFIRSLMERLNDQAIKDPLTGTLNRRQLALYMNDSLLQKKKFNIDAAIVMFDIDFFKEINDSLGHGYGDTVIKKVSDHILGSIDSDKVLFRLGGDEFLLLLPNVSPSKAFTIANKIRQKIERESLPGSLHFSVSAGVSGIVGKTGSTEAWMQCADKALYTAKEAGKNCVKSYHLE